MDKLVIGHGYLGSRVSALWRAQGHRVFATTRSQQRVCQLTQLGLVPLLCDVLDAASLHVLPRVDAVVYCVGLDRHSGHSMREVYVQGLENVLRTLPPARRFLYVSSTGVYGQHQGELVDETAATEPEEESGRIVLEADRLLRRERPGAVILRFGGIYGPGRLLARQQALLAGEPMIGNPQRWLNLIHVEDGARAILAAEEQASEGRVYNVCDDCPVQRRQFYSLLAHLLGAPSPRFVPADPAAPPPRERANRRISNRRLRVELHFDLRYPSYEQGLPASLFPEQ